MDRAAPAHPAGSLAAFPEFAAGFVLLFLALAPLVACAPRAAPLQQQETAMPLEPDERLSADVIVRAAGGRTVEAATEITAANVAEFAPSTVDRARARDAFRELGFEIGPEGPIGFAVVADVATFERAFEVRLRRDERGAVRVVDAAGEGSDLPLAALPEELRARLVAVGFAEPPDFGPGAFGP